MMRKTVGQKSGATVPLNRPNQQRLLFEITRPSLGSGIEGRRYQEPKKFYIQRNPRSPSPSPIGFIRAVLDSIAPPPPPEGEISLIQSDTAWVFVILKIFQAYSFLLAI
jgi:hypothetical protein